MDRIGWENRGEWKGRMEESREVNGRGKTGKEESGEDCGAEARGEGRTEPRAEVNVWRGRREEGKKTERGIKGRGERRGEGNEKRERQGEREREMEGKRS